ncbi:MAG: N-acetyltransferase [Bacillota bacterium]|nr:N-acetyltransferase [Bacillota bacterium]MDP4171622.1 N-acetyltransferase [Bacillota bacterium]
MIIRSEKQKDYFDIAEIHALSFTYSHGMGEVPLVDVHRHRKEFDSDLSLVAEEDGRVVGHCLFTTHKLLLNGETIKAAILAPIAVDPNVQKKGIGRQLIEEGHKRLMDKGYEMALLLGHSDYYPRFGYETNMFGTCHIEIERSKLHLSGAELSERRVAAADLPWLSSLWDQWFSDVDLALKPGNSILDWISNDKSTVSSVVVRNSEAIGYIRYSKASPSKFVCFLAKSALDVSEMLGYIHAKCSDVPEQPLIIPVHPESSAVKQFIQHPYEQKMGTWAAAMIKELTPNPLIIKYVEEMKAGNRNCGLIIWPVEFDVC